MEEGRKTHARKGCIKTTTGPWIARRVGADGAEKLSLRRPSQAEREKNQQRERLRRSVKAKIFACLRTYGNYHLPKHPDHNDILKALCEEAGWHVEEDGTISRKETAPITSKAMSESNCEVHLRQACEEDCRYNLSLTLSLPF